MIKITLKIMAFCLGALILFYAIGPRPTFEKIDFNFPSYGLNIGNLESYIAKKEQGIDHLKPGNAAEIVWYDSAHQKTPYSVVYLHGFSASHEEGSPVHRNFAERYGCNLFLSRLEDHGRTDSNSFYHLTPKNYIESAYEALSIGNALGEKTILMSCSTGSTLSASLAAHFPDKVYAQIMYSPNIDLYGPMTEALIFPWGKQLAEMSLGGEYNRINYRSEAAQYWNSVYHINGILAIKSLINQTMHEGTFSKITQPLFMGYFYKNEVEQDQVVSVPAMIDFFTSVATPSDKKVKQAFPNAGRHVITSHILSADYQAVQNATFKFAEEVLGLSPVKGAIITRSHAEQQEK